MEALNARVARRAVGPSWLHFIPPRPRTVLVTLPAIWLLCLLISFLGSSRRAQYWGRADTPERDEWPLTRLIMDAANVRPGMQVADVGAGGGYFTFRFAREVGPRGRVVATDIDPHMIGELYLERMRRSASNVTPRLVDSDDVGLPVASTDLVLVMNTYQFRDCTESRNRRYLRDLARALRPRGRVIIADDFVHSAGWVSPAEGRPSRCGNLPPTALARLASPHLTVERTVSVVLPGHRYAPREAPGYLLVLARADATTQR